MSTKRPKVSIGLAVYNGENYLAEAVDSILAQTFTDFELIISDNDSTDRTQEICLDYAAQDTRIRYYRNATNIGGANNENRTFELSEGEYFQWFAHDDACAPQLLEKCVSVLDKNPDVVLCHAQIVTIDQFGKQLEVLDQDKSSAASPYKRFRYLASNKHQCEATYGLVRSEMLRQTGLQRNYTDSDRTLLCHLALLGRFHQVPEKLFYKRIHPQMSTQVYATWRERMAWFDPANRFKVTFPYWLQFAHYLEIIRKAPLSVGGRIKCYLHMGAWLVEYRRWSRLIKEVFMWVNVRLQKVVYSLRKTQKA